MENIGKKAGYVWCIATTYEISYNACKNLAKMNENKIAYNSRIGMELYRLVEKLSPYLLWNL